MQGLTDRLIKLKVERRMAEKLIWMELWAGDADANMTLFVRGHSDGNVVVAMTSNDNRTMFTQNEKFSNYDDAIVWLQEHHFHQTAPRHDFK